MTQGCDSGDAAAYVLGALDGTELDRFRSHLDGCAVCRDEVAALSPVASMMATSVPQHPAPRALGRRIMNEVRQEQRARVRTRRVRTRFMVPALGGAVGLAVALVLIIGGSVPAPTRTQTIRAQVIGEPGASAVLQRAGSHTVLSVAHLPSPPSGEIYEIWEREGTHPQPTDALFNVTSSGAATAVVPGNLKHVNAVMVTAEPLGGSTVPTAAPVIFVAL